MSSTDPLTANKKTDLKKKETKDKIELSHTHNVLGFCFHPKKRCRSDSNIITSNLLKCIQIIDHSKITKCSLNQTALSPILFFCLECFGGLPWQV